MSGATRRRRVARLFLVLAIVALVFGGVAVGTVHSFSLSDFTWGLGSGPVSATGQ